MKPRKGRFFVGGVHVPDKKELSRDMPIVEMDSPEIVSICLGQHIGKPAEPIVTVGEEVLQGQCIARTTGFVSANIYSSVSGEVIGIEKRANPAGVMQDYIVIKNDYHYVKKFLPPLDKLDGSSIKMRIQEAGIVGMGGAGFPTVVKLSPPSPVDTLIINGAECEPYLTCDYRLMIEKTDEVVQGIRFLKTALNVKNVIVAIEENKPDAIRLFSQYEDLDIVTLKKRYPMGSEKHLIYCTTGRRVPPGKLPSDVQCVVQNIATSYACFEAVRLNKPLFERVMTVSGEGILHPNNLLVKNGTRFEDIITFCGGVRENASVFISGGPMMGLALLSTDMYTRKTDSGLIVLTDRTESKDIQPCIHCGRCASVCPMRLLPMMIDFYTLAGEYQKADTFGGVRNCISCGSCAYVCPAGRALVQSITLCKRKLAEAKK